MESNRSQRRSFSRSKTITSFYRAAARPSLPQHGSKAPKPSPPITSPKAAPNSIAAGSPAPMGFIIVKQDQVYPQPAQKVAFVVPDRNRDSYYGKLGSFYGGMAEDEGVDAKAAEYITAVQERFRSG